MHDEAIPKIIHAAGDSAVAAYRAFFDDGKWSPLTRKCYASNARRFFQWAGARGLLLQVIEVPILDAYATEILGPKSTNELTSVRGVLRHLARSGILAHDPFGERVPEIILAAGDAR